MMAMQNQSLRVHVRWMIRRDMPEVLDIEKLCFEFPWSGDDFLRCLREKSVIGLSAEDSRERVAGFMVYQLHKSRLEILNFAVHPDHRGRKVGSQMIHVLASKLMPGRRDQITAHVRETNLPAQLFFKAAGFRATAVVGGFYADSTEDAYLMRYTAECGGKA